MGTRQRPRPHRRLRIGGGEREDQRDGRPRANVQAPLEPVHERAAQGGPRPQGRRGRGGRRGGATEPEPWRSPLQAAAAGRPRVEDAEARADPDPGRARAPAGHTRGWFAGRRRIARPQPADPRALGANPGPFLVGWRQWPCVLSSRRVGPTVAPAGERGRHETRPLSHRRPPEAEVATRSRPRVEELKGLISMCNPARAEGVRPSSRANRRIWSAQPRVTRSSGFAIRSPERAPRMRGADRASSEAAWR